MAKTISFVKGKGSLSHNNRKFVAKNVDEDRIEMDEVFVSESIEEAYEKCFGAVLKEYNDNQKRADRKKDNYIKEIENSGNGENVFYENVAQIGDMNDTGILLQDGTINPEAEVAADILREYALSFQERNPNLYLFNAVLHMDEATPHLHLDYIPIAHGYKTGMHTRNSLTKAFQEMGFPKATSNKRTETMMWQERERKYITELAKERGLEITVKGEKRPSLSLPEYKEAMHEVAEIKAEIEQNNNILSKQNERIISFKEEGDKLSKRNKDLRVEIMSKEEIKKLPVPETTMFGEFYKIPWNQYQRLVATAKQVDVIKKEYEKKEAASAETIKDMDQKIKKLKKKVEYAKKIPMKEKMELYSLQKMKKGLEWVVSQIPEGKVKNLLKDILRGKDVTIPEITKVRSKNRGIAM